MNIPQRSAELPVLSERQIRMLEALNSPTLYTLMCELYTMAAEELEMEEDQSMICMIPNPLG
jgi:hypothetical protein